MQPRLGILKCSVGERVCRWCASDQFWIMSMPRAPHSAWTTTSFA